MKNIKLILILGLFMTSTSFAFDHSHQDFSKILSQHVTMAKDKTSSSVDYKNIDKNELETYLAKLTAVSKNDFSKFSHKQQLAFFINAYNGFTLKIILDNYPVKSIKDIGSFFSSTWKKNFFSLLGKKRHLDEIEHDLVRANNHLNKDPRIHFAFNCASIGCPALLNTAWTAEKLEDQFDKAAIGFLKDRSRNRTNAKKGRVELNNIFKWYGKDFNKPKYGSLKKFLKSYESAIADDASQKALIQSQKFSISYTGYDWKLNKTK